MKSTDEDENSNVDIREGFQLNETAEQEINIPITEKEILDSIISLKNNKVPGPYSIVNEHIKSTALFMLPTYAKLSNLILDSGIIYESWTVGTISLFLKNKGDPKLPENYRPITLLKCFGKLFTQILNTR